MTEFDEKEIKRYLYDRSSRSSIKGVPRLKDDPGDKANEEIYVAELICKYLEIEHFKLWSEPLGSGKMPDVKVLTDRNEAIGIEVTELIDDSTAAERRKVLKYQKENEIEPADDYKSYILDTTSTPNYNRLLDYRIWTKENLQTKLEKIVTVKNEKLKNNKIPDDFNKMILAIFTGELIDIDMAESLSLDRAEFGGHFDEVILILDYDPARQKEPVIKIQYQ
ncbi:MAG: hypothetical protein KGO21_04295 [Hyphomicrobiales bacterium]|nr:hypothetical protein [Hyphomicrobiales bacterium]